MNFKSLRNMSNAEKYSVLSEVSRNLLPAAVPDPELSQGAVALVKELRERFGVAESFDDRKKTALLQLLSKEIQNILTTGEQARIRDIRHRVGQKGLLSSESYAVVLTEEYKTYSEGLGVDGKLAAAIVRKPLAVEHLSPEMDGLFGVDSHSLFLGPHPRHKEAFVLVLALRDKDRLLVERAWLLFLDVFSAGDSPLGILRSFVDKFGVSISILKSPFRKFHYLETGELNQGLPMKLSFAESGKSNLKCDVRLSYAAINGKLSVALAFAIDVEEFIDYLKGHGVEISRRLGNSGVPMHRELKE